MKLERNERGFKFGDFKDRYGADCTLLKSSLATEDCIWLGIKKAKPMIMASDAIKLGIKTDETTGWIDYLLPEEVFISTTMHLTQEQVKNLLPILIKFAETGEL